MDIFVVKTSSTKNISEDLLKQFQKKLFSDKNALKMHCLSYLMLDRILKEVYQIENREVTFEDNKPVLKSGKKHFSISHSKDYIALGFSEHNCGIDIEMVSERRNWAAIAKRMGFESQTKEEFYKDWTEYEAKYKIGGKYDSIYTAQIDEYMLTAVSENQNEEFEIYLQN